MTFARGLAASGCERQIHPLAWGRALTIWAAAIRGEGPSPRRCRRPAARRESQHALLEHLVADRKHVIAAGNVERLRAGDERRPVRPASPRQNPWLPTATSTGTRMAATSSRDSVCREPRMHAASALRSDLVCSAKARKVRPNGSCTSASDGASIASATRGRQRLALHQIDAEPAEDRAAHALRMRERHEGGDARTHGIPHDVGALDIEMIHAVRGCPRPSTAL